jgi:succinate dehydrogenase / fumarate reductase cytochrome b subunit
MALKRIVGLAAGARYRGGGPMLAWALHRISGLTMILFISTHVLASFFQHQLGNDLGTTINIIYESIYFQVFIYFAVIFHTLNGLRIVILDTWPGLLEYQREATWLQWLIFIPVYGLTIFMMVSRAASGG